MNRFRCDESRRNLVPNTLLQQTVYRTARG